MKVLALAFAALCAAVTAAPASPSADLAGLLKDYDEAHLRLHPSDAVWRGDTRFLDRFENTLAPEYLAEARKENAGFEQRLSGIDRSRLDAQDQLSYDIFAWQLDDEARALTPGVAEHFQMIALNQFGGAQITFPAEMAWRGRFPFTTAQDYEKALGRMKGFARWIDAAIVQMRRGMAQGVTLPRIVAARVLAQAEEQAQQTPEKSVFYAVVRSMPDAIEGAERIRIQQEYKSTIGDSVLPAYRRLAMFLKADYLPNARDSVGLSQIPGGKAMYLSLVRHHTTLSRTPDEIHALGLSEIRRIHAEMEAVKSQTGFTGPLAAFEQFLRTDPRFKFKNKDAMMAAYRDVKRRIAANVPRLFGQLPQTPYRIEFFAPFVAPTQAAAEYAPPSADGARPGIFRINPYDLPSRPAYTTEVLSLHESMPGHHLQIALQQENGRLPAFRRFGGPNAFVEGWGLYAESLGKALGLYKDPYQYFGMLSFDAWRAARLVVDTGIHWQGWSEQQALAYMLANTALTHTDAVAEVERYIAIPAQALAYKTGQLDFLALKRKAERRLGRHFDIRAFHDALLREGAMPLALENAQMDRWIADQDASAGQGAP